MRRALASAAVAVTVAACTQLQWVDMHTGSPKGADAALAECQQSAQKESWRAQWVSGWPPPFYHPYRRYPGWRRPFWIGQPWNDDLFYYLTDFCMRSKGFRQVEVPEAAK